MMASEAVSRAQAVWAGGVVTDPKMAISVTKSEMKEVSVKISTLSNILQSSGRNPTKYSLTGKKKLSESEQKPLGPKLPPLPSPKASGWESVVIESNSASRKMGKSPRPPRLTWTLPPAVGSGALVTLVTQLRDRLARWVH